MNNPQRFFLWASFFEGFLGVLGFVIAATAQSSWTPFLFRFEWAAFGLSFLYLIPPLMVPLVFCFSFFRNMKPLQKIHMLLKESLGDAILGLSVSELFFISMVAGIGEEFLFRGALQPLLGIFFTSLIFGMLHFLSITYALFSFLMSFYLGWVLERFHGNLIGPVFIHGFYDFIAFLVLKYTLRY